MFRSLAVMILQLFAITSVLAQDGPDYADVRQAMENEPVFAEQYAQCPADLFESERPIWRIIVPDQDLDQFVCEQNAMHCYQRCTQSSAGGACLGLALALQDSDDDKDGRYHQQLFTRACSLGDASGCTNRGAGIRNGSYEDDPFVTMDESGRNACLFRTFETACGEDSEWGCAMLGQAHRFGEGTPRDIEKAKIAYENACGTNDTFAACRFATSALDEIGEN
ncbi:SEL1-like repeat protein [Aliihoeflea sp. PC F10.4]